jgi:hypothetical protein
MLHGSTHIPVAFACRDVAHDRQGREGEAEEESEDEPRRKGQGASHDSSEHSSAWSGKDSESRANEAVEVTRKF